MKRPPIFIEFKSTGRAHIRGPGARELIETATGRTPLWNASARAWTTSEGTARDVACAADAEGRYAIVTGQEVGAHV